MRIVGLDAGSVSVKVVVLDAAGSVVHREYRKHRGHAAAIALELLTAAGVGPGCAIAVTGSSGKRIAAILGIEAVNEIVAQAYATLRLHPQIRTVIEMGGEDSKLILLGAGAVKDFSMNSVCAAGTGSFLDQQAGRLRLSIEAFGELALESDNPPRIAGRCSVFAKSDMIHLQQIATPVSEIVAGLCFAVARNFRGSIARGRVIETPVAFQGGVAANRGMVRAFREVLGLDELFVPPDFALMGALGAALKARDENSGAAFRLEALAEHLARESGAEAGHPPLLQPGDAFAARHLTDPRDVGHAPSAGGAAVPVFMGIDIGSISTNIAVVDGDGRLLSKRYLMTAGRPIEAVRQGLRETAAELGGRVTIAGVGTTGSGRYMIADYVGADIVRNEITAQATAAAFIDPDVDTIFEIGGQDSKFISLEGGVIVDFEMNKACAAGTGSFLEEQAEKLEVSVKREFAERAFSSSCPSKLGERCTVFMENSLMSLLQRGVPKNDLFAGLAYSIVQNYINRVVAGRPIGRKILFQGGVAFNKSVVAAFEKHLGVTVTVPPNHDVTGAIGMALLVQRHLKAAGGATAFKGYDCAERPYTISTFGCGGCTNLCEINRITVAGETRPLFYGGRCEKYDIDRKGARQGEDLFAFRDELLWRPVRELAQRRAQGAAAGGRARLGLPYVFYFSEYLPYWATLLGSLGFDLEVSPPPNRRIVDLGLESVLSEACFPVKVAVGHVRHLKDAGVDAVFLPSFVNLNEPGAEYPLGVACPHTQSIPYVARVSVPGVEILAPVVDLSRGRGALATELAAKLRRYGVNRSRIVRAMAAAQRAQDGFAAALRAKGEAVLAEKASGPVVVIVGRSYNALERGMNLRIPEKLATLGVRAIPLDMLPLEAQRLKEDWPDLYWRSGQKILRAARFIAGREGIYPIVIGNFSCGPDSFILKDFKTELRGKPFLHIEIDEHSADAGAVTRCEAFLDSIAHRGAAAPAPPAKKRRPAAASLKDRVVYLPRMSDHAEALAAAFERCGMRAEVLPPSDRETVELGMKHVSGKECYPCAVTTGDLVKKALSPGFDPARSAFFMPSGSGPCRFGRYTGFHRSVLAELGLEEVPVFAPNQDAGFYDALDEVGSDFTLYAWKGVVAVDLLNKCLHETRPYETRPGSADELHRHHLGRLVQSVAGRNGRVEDALKKVRRDFEELPQARVRKPLIGVVGEIFVRSNAFSNEDVVRKIEALGGEACLAPVEEWLHYVNHLNVRHALAERKYGAAAGAWFTGYLQKRMNHALAGGFEGFLRTAEEPSTAAVIRQAAPYVHDSFEGEAVLSVGKAVDFVGKGAHGVVNTMPFGCMPGTIVTALLRAVTRDLGLPVISVAYDGTAASTNEIQLEAFMDQARSRVAATV